MNTDKSESIFINGKAQIIEMLQYMQPQERRKLLQQIRAQSLQLADELMTESIGFEHISSLNDNELTTLFKLVEAPILGVAIRGINRELQKKILALSDRKYAEKAYQYMTASLSNGESSIKRAREKVRLAIHRCLSRD